MRNLGLFAAQKKNSVVCNEMKGLGLVEYLCFVFFFFFAPFSFLSFPSFPPTRGEYLGMLSFMCDFANVGPRTTPC